MFQYSFLPLKVALRFAHPDLLILDTTVAQCVQRGREFLQSRLVFKLARVALLYRPSHLEEGTVETPRSWVETVRTGVRQDVSVRAVFRPAILCLVPPTRLESDDRGIFRIGRFGGRLDVFAGRGQGFGVVERVTHGLTCLTARGRL